MENSRLRRTKRELNSPSLLPSLLLSHRPSSTISRADLCFRRCSGDHKICLQTNKTGTWLEGSHVKMSVSSSFHLPPSFSPSKRSRTQILLNADDLVSLFLFQRTGTSTWLSDHHGTMQSSFFRLLPPSFHRVLVVLSRAHHLLSPFLPTEQRRS